MRSPLYLATILVSLSFAGCDGDKDPPATPDGPPAGTDAMVDAPPTNPPAPSMTFFITSASGPLGGDFRRPGMNDQDGLAGADEHCRTLAAAADASHANKPWRAYLSTSTVNAKDRIGKGPWYNQKLVKVADSVADLLDPAFPGKNKIDGNLGLDEKGAVVARNSHDILTGSNADGTNSGANCQNWTSNADGVTGTLGHHDRSGGNSTSWSTAHASRGCSAAAFVLTGGRGSLYCFVAN